MYKKILDIDTRYLRPLMGPHTKTCDASYRNSFLSEHTP